MNDLIKIEEKDGSLVVSARDLHTFLESNQRFSDWIKNMLGYGFELGRDYGMLGYSYSGQIIEEDGIYKEGIADNLVISRRDYFLTIDTAKHISMIQRSEKGTEVRRYFIEIEKKYRASASPSVAHSKLVDLELAALFEKITQIVQRKDRDIKVLTAKAAYSEKILTSDHSLTVTEIAKELGISGQNLNDFLEQKGIQYKHRDHYVLYAHFQDKGYVHFKTVTYRGKDKENRSTLQMLWTERGRAFIHYLYNPHMFSKDSRPKPAVKKRLVPKRKLKQSVSLEVSPVPTPSSSEVIGTMANEMVFRPETRGQLLKALQENKKCEVPESSSEVTSIILSTAHNFPTFKTYPSENIGWMVYEAVPAFVNQVNAI